MHNPGSRFLMLCLALCCLASIASACDPPYVGINSVKVGDTVAGVQTLKLWVRSETEVEGVDIYLDGKLVGSSSPAIKQTEDGQYEGPCEFEWDTREIPNGSHELYAKARAVGREDGASAKLTVTVDNPVDPPDQSPTTDSADSEVDQPKDEDPPASTGSEPEA